MHWGLRTRTRIQKAPCSHFRLQASTSLDNFWIMKIMSPFIRMWKIQEFGSLDVQKYSYHQNMAWWTKSASPKLETASQFPGSEDPPGASRLGARGISTSWVVPCKVWPTCGISTTFSTVWTLEHMVSVFSACFDLDFGRSVLVYIMYFRYIIWVCHISGLRKSREGSQRSSQWFEPNRDILWRIRIPDLLDLLDCMKGRRFSLGEPRWTMTQRHFACGTSTCFTTGTSTIFSRVSMTVTWTQYLDSTIKTGKFLLQSTNFPGFALVGNDHTSFCHKRSHASTGFSTGTWTGTWRCFCTGMWTWLSLDQAGYW